MSQIDKNHKYIERDQGMAVEAVARLRGKLTEGLPVDVSHVRKAKAMGGWGSSGETWRRLTVTTLSRANWPRLDGEILSNVRTYRSFRCSVVNRIDCERSRHGMARYIEDANGWLVFNDMLP